MARQPTDLFTPAVELAAAVRRKEVSPVELVERAIDRMDAVDDRINAFCFRADDDVRKAAAIAADAVVAAGEDELPPFHGVPLPVKDAFDVAGWPTTYGSRATNRAPAATTDRAVQRLIDAGCLVQGKTTLSELATVCVAESDALGITRNPWDLDRTPGGSSGGSAAAVAAGMAPFAYGADGGGSLRIPASCTGLVGLKATRGRVAGDAVELDGLVTTGVLARSVTDVAASLDVQARHDPAAWFSPPSPAGAFADVIRRPAPPLRIGVLVDAPIDGLPVDPACAAAVDATVRVLEAAGHHIVDEPVHLPPPEELIATFTAMWNVAAATVPVEDPDALEPHNRLLREAARALDSWSYVQAVHRAQHLSRDVVEAFVDRFDLLVTPTMACLPPPVGAWRAGTEQDPLRAVRNVYPMAVFTSLFNVTGQPAISVPVHHDTASGLPVGVQLVAAPWREDLLLQVARTLEQACAWLDRYPDLGKERS